ncbi:MAG: hypothetical protein AB1894_15695 [Chloroflexota bacterium]
MNDEKSDGSQQAPEPRRRTRARKPGAQPGNSNALKHGYYSRKFRTIDYNDLDVVQATMESEIAAARVVARRMFDHVSQIEDAGDPMAAIQALAMLGTQLHKVAGLLRSYTILTGSDKQGSAAITQAIESVLQEMKLKK